MITVVDAMPADGLPIYTKTEAVVRWFMMDGQLNLCEMNFDRILVPLLPITEKVMAAISEAMKLADERGCCKGVVLARDDEIGFLSMEMLPFIYVRNEQEL
jgi:hypothetical protein